MDGFEVFDRVRDVRRGPPPGGPAISLTKPGILNLNEAAVTLADQPETVLLLYDAGRRIIAFRKAATGDPRAYRVTRSKGRGATGYYKISVVALCRRLGVEVTETRRFNAETFGEGIVGIRLDDGIASPQAVPRRSGPTAAGSPTDDRLTLVEAARALGLSLSRTQKAVRAGTLVAELVPQRGQRPTYLVTPAAIEDYRAHHQYGARRSQREGNR